MSRILVVNDDPILLEYFVRILHSDFEVVDCFDAQEAARIAKIEHFDAILLDVLMPTLNSPESYKAYRHLSENVSIIAVLPNHEYKLAHVATQIGADDVVEMPVEPSEILRHVHELVD